MDTLLIRNGTVVNAEDGTMVQADILAEGSRIRKAEPGICDRAVSEIDATGCYVTPGLVDHHTHIYPMASIGISGEAVCFGSGVTTAVDAGSTGCGTYERYRPWIRASKLAVCPYIHVSTGGFPAFRRPWRMWIRTIWTRRGSGSCSGGTGMSLRDLRSGSAGISWEIWEWIL